jgi:hypothetical protein
MTCKALDINVFLEPTQLAAVVEQPLPRRKLSPRVLTLLWVLRIYVFIAIPIVGYAFIHALHSSN